MSACLFLVRKGVGSLKEVQDLDTSEFLDCLEYLEIESAIEKHLIEEARNNG